MSPMITLRLQVDRLPLARTSLLAAPSSPFHGDGVTAFYGSNVVLSLTKAHHRDRHDLAKMRVNAQGVRRIRYRARGTFVLSCGYVGPAIKPSR